MDIGTKHLGAGFEAGFEGLKPMEIRAKQHDKEGPPFFVPQNVTKSRRTKWASPVNEATQHYAEIRAPPSQEPRDHTV